MRMLILLSLLLHSTFAQAQGFNDLCNRNWHRQEMRPEFIDLLEHPKKISIELTQNLLNLGSLAELELRLLEKALEQEARFQIHYSEIQSLLSRQQSCNQAEILASGIPLREFDYSEIKKLFTYQVENRQDETPELTKSYDTLKPEPLSSKKWVWISAAIGVVAAAYFQRHYEIEY